MASVLQSSTLQLKLNQNFKRRNVSLKSVTQIGRCSRFVTKCSSEVESARKNRIIIPLIGSAIMAGIALTGPVSGNAVAEASFSLMHPQVVAVIAEVEEVEVSTPAPPLDAAAERALKLKQLLAQKRLEAEAKAAAAKAEEASIAKANKDRLALEAADRGAQTKAADVTAAPAPEKPTVAPAPATPVPAATSSKQASAPVVEASTSMKKATHGFLPLFLAQFLVLAGFGGFGVAAVIFSASYWETLLETAESAFSKVSPKIEAAWITSKPAVEKGIEIASKLANEAKPYVVKAAEAAKPLALEAIEKAKPLAKEAIEKAKPLVKQGQEKAIGLFNEAQEKVKNSLKNTES